ncbi:UvrD-helicase domain-containing protein [bacterium]|nr:UvrD-helicase domain-containing protein [bacterium]
MLIDGSISSNKTQILVEEYARLINSGISSREILVLVNNSSAKERFCEQSMSLLNVDCIEKMQVYSFFGLVYNTVIDNWAILENLIKGGKTTVIPNLIGLEVSQFLLKDIIKDIKFEGYNSKKSLLQQLFRRYSLIIQNNLSDKDVEWRSEQVLKEGFAEDTKKAIKSLLSKTLNYRSFDYLRQTLLFNYLYQNTDVFNNIKYIFVDDADEITPVCFDFISSLKPQLTDIFVGCDSNGSSRTGYLSADKNIYIKFENLLNCEAKKLSYCSKMAEDAENLYSNILGKSSCRLKYFSHISPSKRATMIDLAALRVEDFLKAGFKPSDIAIITPTVDDMLKFSLKEKIKNSNLLFLSGSEKLIQNPYVQSALTILKLNTDLKKDLTEFDLRIILSDVLEIPVRHCKSILEHFEKSKKVIDYEFNRAEYTEKYQKFKKLTEELQNTKLRPSESVYKIYKELFNFYGSNRNEINKFSFFIKELQDFEDVFGSDIKLEDVILQIENSVIAENPYSTIEINEKDLVIATPQKIIDNQIKTKFQLWLDVSSSEWVKNDTGPLYNSWVFQSDWDKNEYTINDDIELSTQKTARLLRKLILCAKDFVYTFSSLFDVAGVENFGGIEQYFKQEEEKKSSIGFKFTPREDQKPVLNYTKGKMAISAVPGAGKTTILLALIIKLLNDGVNPENIFVLTYMESAARNFRERIKNINPENTKLPNISTIHGLALRILKDNSNYERLGLAADFEICDDSQRGTIIQKASSALKLKKNDTEDFDRAISVFKLGGGILPKTSKNDKLNKFIDFYKIYQDELKSQNTIDYDDILISSVKLLEENEDILKYYQDICKYIIEDEAQDSSAVQQKLIALLSGKHKNLIRCGDINQAITTTFSNADTEGFRKFIKDSQSVEMDCSQRCCHDVWKLANNLIIFAEKNKAYQNAFYRIFMRPVEGKNPVSERAVNSFVFENGFAEKNYILKQIKEILSINPKATIGILLRTNYQVGSWLSFINNAGFKSISRSECLEQKSVYQTIYSVLKIIQSPFDNNILAQSYEILAENGFYKQRLQTEITGLDLPFVLANVDEMNIDLAKFYWDVIYWLSFASLPIEELAVKIGLHYHKSDIEKSNVYLISMLIKRLSSSNRNFSEVLNKLAALAKRPNLSGFKFFSEEDETDREFLEGKIQIMTYHKSKGDEFDYVFLPEFTEKSLSIDFNKTELKKNTDFMEQVKSLNPVYNKKSETELKQEQIAENLRLLYVAITRAKKRLVFTVAQETKSYGKIQRQEPSIIFEKLLKGGY